MTLGGGKKIQKQIYKRERENVKGKVALGRFGNQRWPFSTSRIVVIN